MPCRECMPNLYALIPQMGWAIAASAILLGASTWRFRRPLPAAFALAAIAAPLAGMHTHVYDMMFLFLAVVLIRARARLLAAWAISPAPYLLPYFCEAGRVVPALTALAMWIAIFLPGSAE